MDKIAQLEEEYKRYSEKLKHMSTEYAATREGSAYGVEYYDIQCRVLASMLEGIRKEIESLKAKKS